jgi:hypothetical protein
MHRTTADRGCGMTSMATKNPDRKAGVFDMVGGAGFEPATLAV